MGGKSIAEAAIRNVGKWVEVRTSIVRAVFAPDVR